MSKLMSAGSALNIAENAKISESALKMTEYLTPGSYQNDKLHASTINRREHRLMLFVLGEANTARAWIGITVETKIKIAWMGANRNLERI